MSLARRHIGIPREQYTRDYYLSDRCEGFQEYSDRRGISHVKGKLLRAVDPKPGERILEIGCGRGEVLLQCIERGADGVGLDYASEAARLTRETTAGRAAALQADAADVPFRDDSFDVVFLGDVLEHLTRPQAESMLAESHRVLRPSGRLVLHTSPNVLFIRLVFPFVLVALVISGRWGLFRTFVAQYRTIREFHVVEYSGGRLRRLFQRSPYGAFEVRVDPDLLRGGKSRYTESLARSPFVTWIASVASREPLVRVFSNDLWVMARKAP